MSDHIFGIADHISKTMSEHISKNVRVDFENVRVHSEMSEYIPEMISGNSSSLWSGVSVRRTRRQCLNTGAVNLLPTRVRAGGVRARGVRCWTVGLRLVIIFPKKIPCNLFAILAHV